MPFSIEKVANKILTREHNGRKFSIIVVAEGAMPVGGKAVYQAKNRLGGIGNQVAVAIEELTGKETRVVVLGHLQRGGQPTSADRLLASSLGVSAVHLIAKGNYGQLVGLIDNQIGATPLAQAIASAKTVPPDGYLVNTARALGISFASETVADY